LEGHLFDRFEATTVIVDSDSYRSILAVSRWPAGNLACFA
jgi:hypothetical protein